MADLKKYLLQNVEGLEKLKERGRGCYGSVFELTVNGVPCIGKRLHSILVGRVKEINVSDEDRLSIIAKFKNECDVLASLRHPNIVQFMGVHFGETGSEDVTLIMEALHMDLEKCINTYGSGGFPLPYKLQILRDVAYGLSYLHSCSVIHRDLNQGNVLLTESLTAKIADLGASKVVEYSSEILGLSTLPGAIAYMPPEAMQSPAIYNEKLDCFSFGHLSLYLLNEKFPNLVDADITYQDVQQKGIQRAKRRSSIVALGNLHVMHNVIIQCLADEPLKRPTSRELATIMTNVCSLIPLQHKNILDLVGVINEQMKMDTSTDAGLQNEISMQVNPILSVDSASSELLKLSRSKLETERRHSNEISTQLPLPTSPLPSRKPSIPLSPRSPVSPLFFPPQDYESPVPLPPRTYKPLPPTPNSAVSVSPGDAGDPFDSNEESMRKRSLTELFNEYDSDDDNYESVNEFKVVKDGKFRAKKTASTVKGDPANQIRDISVTGSLPSTITPYAVANNFVSSSGNFMFGKMSREVAESLCCNCSDYLVRASPTTGGLVLSVRLDDDTCGHLSIQKTVSKNLKTSKVGYFFNDGEIFNTLSELITYLASVPFRTGSTHLIHLKNPVTKEDRRIWESNQFVTDSLINKKKQYSLSSAVVTSNNEEITTKCLTSNQHQILWEGYILSQLDHANVVKFVGVCVQKPISLLLERCARNTLSEYLISHRKTIDMSGMHKMVVDLAAGMAHLHYKGILHRNLATRNCVLSDDFTTAKIANLQKSTIISKSDPVVSNYANFAVGWASPEVLKSGEYSVSSDVWSFGVLMWEIFTHGKEPYPGLNKAQILDKIHSNSMIELNIPFVPATCDEAFGNCLKYHPKDRPSFKELHYQLIRQEDDTNEPDYI